MNAFVPAKIKSQRSESQNSPREVRVAYPYFHEKRLKNAAGQPFLKKDGTPNPRYSATFMFPKLAANAAECANYNWLWSLAVEAAKKMWPTNVDAQGNWTWPQGAQYPVKDGDVPFTSKPKPGQPMLSPEEIAKKNVWRRGYWIVEAENFLDPGPRIAKIINGIPTELPAKVINGIAEYKGGDFGIPNMHAYAYQNETFGVNFGFDGFCFTREGDPIGASGPRSAQQMFGSIAGTVVQPASPAPNGSPAAPPVSPQPNYAAPGPAAPPAMPAPPLAPQMAPPAPPAPPAMPSLPQPGAPAAPPSGLPAFPMPQ